MENDIERWETLAMIRGSMLVRKLEFEIRIKLGLRILTLVGHVEVLSESNSALWIPLH